MLELALASQSPRRRELLLRAGFDFRVFPVKVSEIFSENLKPREVASHLATIKVQAAIEQNKPLKSPGFLILGADTIVVLGAQILGKPRDASEAADFLRRLSGTTHSVITGFYLSESGVNKSFTGLDETLVTFRKLSEDEIREYVDSGEPMDKAGAYGIQGAAGKFVSSFTGSKSNVIGLPMERLEEALLKNGWNVRRRKSEEN